MTERYDAEALKQFATEALTAAGLGDEPARSVAQGLLDADLFGHTTHGLALLADYVEELQTGGMEKEGRPEVLASLGAVECWDARRLPGIWTTRLAIEAAAAKAETLGAGIIALRRSHHIACLATFLEAPARKGFIVLVLSSDPSAAFVAPFGGLTPVMTPNPIATGIPADPDPIILDVSMSITTAGMCARTKAAGGRLNGKWLVGPDGQPTDDPNILDKGGALLPMGGLDHGHKGFALGLLVECLTQGLSGYGRADNVKDWGAAVLVMAIKPGAFGPKSDFDREVAWLAQACRASSPLSPDRPVRLPGESAFARRKRALSEGVELHPAIIPKLEQMARELGLRMPEPQLGIAAEVHRR
jgi:LDH2 family malate/lactate/ureidoglycolate dehydrogenase